MSADVTLSISMPPYASGTSAPLRPSSPAFRTSSRSRAKIFVLQLLDVGDDFLDRELFRGLRDEQMLFGEIFGSENLVGVALLDQKTAASNIDSWVVR